MAASCIGGHLFFNTLLDGYLNFYQSKEWRRLRKWAISKFGAKCMSCGSIEHIQVDHILPTSLYWRYRLKKWNVQILCKKCNLKKSNVYIDDLRPLTVRMEFFIIKWIKRALLSSLLFLIGFLWLSYANPGACSQSFSCLLSIALTQSLALLDYLYNAL